MKIIIVIALFHVSYGSLCTTTQSEVITTTPALTGPIPGSNPNGNKAITPFHPCFRPMISYLQLTYGGSSRCEGGPTKNKCKGNDQCLDPYHPWCCQNAKGCNVCSGKK